MRHFRQYLFLGCGNVSAQRSRLLHKRLDEAFNMNAAMEQGYKASKEEEQEVEDVVRDIAAALLGRNIEVGRKISRRVKDGPFPTEWLEKSK